MFSCALRCVGSGELFFVIRASKRANKRSDLLPRAASAGDALFGVDERVGVEGSSNGFFTDSLWAMEAIEEMQETSRHEIAGGAHAHAHARLDANET